MGYFCAPRRHRSDRRFSLVEILFVVVILLLLAGMLLPVLSRSRTKSRFARWQSFMRDNINDERVLVMYDFADLESNPGVLKNLSHGLGITNYEQSRFDIPYTNCKIDEGRWPTKGALLFEGTGYLENAELYAAPQLHEEFAVIAWVKFDSVVGTQNICTISTDSDYGWQLGIRNSRLTVWRKGGTPLAQETADLLPDVWYQVAYVYRDETHWLYRDGTVVATGKGWPDWGPPNTLSIGRWVNGIEYFEGRLDEFIYYRTAISDDDIYDNYRMGQL